VVHVAYMKHGPRCRQYVNMKTDHDEIRCESRHILDQVTHFFFKETLPFGG
jgi:hypothetical protein